MARQLTVVSNGKPPEHYEVLSPQERMMHVRNVAGVVLQDATDVWAELWDELQGKVTDSIMILPQAEKGFRPECGWPEYLERMWRLKHYLDCATRLIAGKA